MDSCEASFFTNIHQSSTVSLNQASSNRSTIKSIQHLHTHVHTCIFILSKAISWSLTQEYNIQVIIGSTLAAWIFWHWMRRVPWLRFFIVVGDRVYCDYCEYCKAISSNIFDNFPSASNPWMLLAVTSSRTGLLSLIWNIWRIKFYERRCWK